MPGGDGGILYDQVLDLKSIFWGWYKRAPIAALRQAKFYPPRQAAALQQALLRRRSTQAAVHKPHYTSRITQAQYTSRSERDSLIYCGSCTVAAMFMATLVAVHKPQYTRDKRVSRVLRQCRIRH